MTVSGFLKYTPFLAERRIILPSVNGPANVKAHGQAMMSTAVNTFIAEEISGKCNMPPRKARPIVKAVKYFAKTEDTCKSLDSDFDTGSEFHMRSNALLETSLLTSTLSVGPSTRAPA